jgi:hypothetical protein
MIIEPHDYSALQSRLREAGVRHDWQPKPASTRCLPTLRGRLVASTEKRTRAPSLMLVKALIKVGDGRADTGS